MNKENETVINIDSLGIDTVKMTDEQVHQVYTELSDVDKASTDNLAAAEKETESSNYTSEDNNVIEATEEIPGVGVTPVNVLNNINETENNIKDALDPYDFTDEETVQIIDIIQEYRKGNTADLYKRLPNKMQDMVNGLLFTESENINPKQIRSRRNDAAKMLIDSFINDAKISATIDDFNSEMNTTISEMNSEYDNMLTDAIDNVFNKIEEIRAENPEQADKIESVKNAFERATTFEKQLEFAKRTSSAKFNKFLTRYKDDVYYFNKKVNNNNVGVKVNNIEELEPIIKLGLPQYSEEDIKKFIICICRTIENVDELPGISYEYRLVSSIYKYKFVPIDNNGEIIFKNISKVIDEILS